MVGGLGHRMQGFRASGWGQESCRLLGLFSECDFDGVVARAYVL